MLLSSCQRPDIGWPDRTCQRSKFTDISRLKRSSGQKFLMRHPQKQLKKCQTSHWKPFHGSERKIEITNCWKALTSTQRFTKKIEETVHLIEKVIARKAVHEFIEKKVFWSVLNFGSCRSLLAFFPRFFLDLPRPHGFQKRFLWTIFFPDSGCWGSITHSYSIEWTFPKLPIHLCLRILAETVRAKFLGSFRSIFLKKMFNAPIKRKFLAICFFMFSGRCPGSVIHSSTTKSFIKYIRCNFPVLFFCFELQIMKPHRSVMNGENIILPQNTESQLPAND